MLVRVLLPIFLVVLIILRDRDRTELRVRL